MRASNELCNALAPSLNRGTFERRFCFLWNGLNEIIGGVAGPIFPGQSLTKYQQILTCDIQNVKCTHCFHDVTLIYLVRKSSPIVVHKNVKDIIKLSKVKRFNEVKYLNFH